MFNRKCDERRGRTGGRRLRRSVSEISPLNQLLQPFNTPQQGGPRKRRWIIMPTPLPDPLTQRENQSASRAAVWAQSPSSTLPVPIRCVRAFINEIELYLYASTWIISALSCFCPLQRCRIFEYRTVPPVPDSFPI